MSAADAHGTTRVSLAYPPTMRTRLLHAMILATVACHAPAPAPAPSMHPPAATATDPAPTATGPTIVPPTIATPEPRPTWEWAVATLPALAGHTEVDPGDAAFARFL